MAIVGRTLRLLALIIWVGGIILFGAVFAPAAAHNLPGNLLSLVIFTSISKLHAIGIGCGIAILIALRLLGNRAFRPLAQVAFAFAMIALTVISNVYVLAPMERDRQAAGGYITALLPGSPLRADFDARHAWSTRLEGGVLICGVALALLVAFEESPKSDH